MSALVASADDVARDWLVALMAEAPLAAAAAVPVADLAREAPALVAAMARALSSDAALDRLAPRGDLAPAAARAGTLGGARDPADAAATVEILRSVLWSAALAELHRPDPAQIADLAARLATVAATVTEATLRARALRAGPEREPAAAEGAAPNAASPGAPAPAPDGPAPAAHGADPGPTPSRSLRRIGQPGEPAELIDLSARDMRPRIAAGDPIDHLSERVTDHARDRRTLAVLLVELDGIDRLMTAGDEAIEAVARAELAIEGLLRPGDGARREAPGRIWITLPGTGPAGARALALRLSVAVERAAEHRGAPLTAAVGVAVFPADAPDALALADRAEEALFSARAAGHRGPQPA